MLRASYGCPMPAWTRTTRSLPLALMLVISLVVIDASPASAAGGESILVRPGCEYKWNSFSGGRHTTFVEWRVSSDDVRITSVEQGRILLEGAVAEMEVPGKGPASFPQVLTIEVAGVEETVDVSSAMHCTGVPDSFKSRDGDLEMVFVHFACHPGNPLTPTLRGANATFQTAIPDVPATEVSSTYDDVLEGTGLFPAVSPYFSSDTATIFDFSGTMQFGFENGRTEVFDVEPTIDCATMRRVAVGPEDRFSDDEGVFESDIEWLASEGITTGCNPPVNDRFCPEDPVTRGQMAAFLSRAFDYVERLGDFVDDDDSVFEADIERLAAAGVTRGCNPPVNDRFCPEDPVTRGQMAAFLRRALRGESSAAGGTDFVDDDGSIFESDIGWLSAQGITAGCNPPVNDRFCPEDPVTRGQMAAFLRRAIGG